MMKRFFYLILIILASGCSSKGTQVVKNNAPSTEIAKVKIDLPREPTNSDLFMQLIWADPGGGEYPGDLGECENCNITSDSSNYFLRGFSPNQNLQLIFYRQMASRSCHTALFLAEINVVVDKNGNLDVAMPDNDWRIFLYSIYDTSTNRLEWQSRLLILDADSCQIEIGDNFFQQYPCKNAFYTRIEYNDEARVCSNLNVRLRTEPVIVSSSRITSLPKGTKVYVIDGPACNDGYVWWFVQTESYDLGWIAEGNPSLWLIEPIP